MSWLDRLTGTVWRDGLDTTGLTQEEVSGLFAEMPSAGMQWRRRPLWLGYALRLRPGAVAPATGRPVRGALPFRALVGKYSNEAKKVLYETPVTVIAFVTDAYRPNHESNYEVNVCAVVMYDDTGALGTEVIHNLITTEGA